MVADGNVLVVWQQRVVGTKELADIRGVEDRRVEIGVIPYRRRQKHFNFGWAEQMVRRRLPVGGGRMLVQERVETAAQSAPRDDSEGHQSIQRIGCAGICEFDALFF